MFCCGALGRRDSYSSGSASSGSMEAACRAGSALAMNAQSSYAG